MESSVIAFILIIATILIGLVVFSLSSIYATYQYTRVNLQQQAESISNGLYISISNNVTAGSTISLFLVPQDFNYNGTIYLTVFYVPSSLKGNQMITPQFAYTQNGEIVYATVNGSAPNVPVTTLYFTNLNIMYQGEMKLWKTITGAPQVITLSPPAGYTSVVLFFVQIQNKFVEVGYEWL
ncbi:hypothetical protein [Sulfurisphaera ohwakuensis]|uniref:Flagellin n=1 Tax=Sulfurisphaera ohwakuensis TaxID=69656 RepID=A0A650CFH9_SULOH|nr:hypothetical protein [Sulfurisphaera ohwakuensis]MBB5255036.1 hypothetical protein [Sulfurisphaera ohwakuensis]QGR16574.1 hypothetical protein D1869_04715 [Sulfurisphaera ohwakuensis]